MIRLENFRRYVPRNALDLLIELRKASLEFDSVVKNLRVTEQAIEFDLYVLHEESKRKTLQKLELDFGKKIGEKDLAVETPFVDKQSILQESVKLFNEQRYWECHETLEQVWRREARGPEKDVEQGIILAASALVHFQRNEDLICLGMIPRTIEKLDSWKDPKYNMIDIGRLKEDLKHIYETKEIRPFKIHGL